MTTPYIYKYGERKQDVLWNFTCPSCNTKFTRRAGNYRIRATNAQWLCPHCHRVAYQQRLKT